MEKVPCKHAKSGNLHESSPCWFCTLTGFGSAAFICYEPTYGICQMAGFWDRTQPELKKCDEYMPRTNR